MVTASDDGTARVWDAAGGRQLAILQGSGDATRESGHGFLYAAFSADGRRVLAASQDGSVRIWPAAGGSEIAILTGHAQAVSSAVFNPDGTSVITGSADNFAHFYPVFRTTQDLIDYANTVLLRSSSR